MFPRQRAAAERPMSWMVTQLYTSVVASRPTHGQRAARLSVATTTVGWRGFGYQEKRTRRASLGGYVLVDNSNSGKAATVSYIVKYKILRRVDSARVSTATPKKGSQSWIGRLGAARSAQRVSSRHQTTTTGELVPAFARICARPVNPSKNNNTQWPVTCGGLWSGV